MRSYILLFIIITALCRTSIIAKSYVLNGGQKSKIKYRVVQLVEPSPVNIENIRLTFVLPQSFSSPTYNQKILEQHIEFSVPPSKVDSSRDKHGNHLVTYTWLKSKKPFTAEMSVVVENTVLLKKITSKAPFPLKNIPAETSPTFLPHQWFRPGIRKLWTMQKNLFTGQKPSLMLSRRY